ncbi:hypothetical protein E2C01_034646 [Portunus trituberculatus]|uniref:Uncharacterized protein n=1 Tax=Portunus trituberculatus TaxID=210409 RepID=A0A5B7F650_PORTR|nr:hypothetical protein [Portunus trituberculatus]
MTSYPNSVTILQMAPGSISASQVLDWMTSLQHVIKSPLIARTTHAL